MPFARRAAPQGQGNGEEVFDSDAATPQVLAKHLAHCCELGKIATAPSTLFCGVERQAAERGNAHRFVAQLEPSAPLSSNGRLTNEHATGS